jgi:hypothetical protein
MAILGLGPIQQLPLRVFLAGPFDELRLLRGSSFLVVGLQAQQKIILFRRVVFLLAALAL